MDPMLGLLLQTGASGLVAVVIISVARALAPQIAAALPAVFSARAQRETQLMDALLAATKAMTETAATLASLRTEVGDLRDAYGDMRDFVGQMADRVGQPRPRRKKEEANVQAG